MTVVQIRRQEQPGLARGHQITKNKTKEAQTSSSCSLGGVRWRVSTSSPHFHRRKSPVTSKSPVLCQYLRLLCWWDDYSTNTVSVSFQFDLLSETSLTASSDQKNTRSLQLNKPVNVSMFFTDVDAMVLCLQLFPFIQLLLSETIK